MTSLLGTFGPSAATQIRMDHSHVLTMAQQYAADISPQAKEALGNMICVALEIHARLEEEIFYPALAIVDPSVMEKNVPEHDEVRQLIGMLRATNPAHRDYDGAFHALVRTVIRHVADEETIVLPEAERLLADRLDALGGQMTERRMQLVISRSGEITRDHLRLLPSTLLLGGAGAMLAGMQALRYAMRRWS